MGPQYVGNSYPEATEFLGARTMIQPGERQGGATKAWAISSVTLGSLYLLWLVSVILVGHFSEQQRHHEHIPMTISLVVMSIAFLLSAGLAFGFVAAGGGVIGRLDLGRKSLVLVSALAIIVTLVGLAAIWSFSNDPRVIAAMMADAPQRQQLAGPTDAYHLMQMSGMLVAGMAAIASAIQVIYCGLLCHHMSSRSARAAMKTF
ncbi:MAG TPA: hypothetical protein VFJ58_12520 [Armatimonadota bacterium]|nr:hypothetical protein [Armatimonadota bacterium]